MSDNIQAIMIDDRKLKIVFAIGLFIGLCGVLLLRSEIKKDVDLSRINQSNPGCVTAGFDGKLHSHASINRYDSNVYINH